MGEVGGGFTPPVGGGEQQFVREVSAPLFAAKGWMKFLGVLMIIYGVFLAITIVGLIICWLPVWIGIILFRAATAAETAQVSGSKAELYTALSKIKTYFTIYGVLALIGLIFAIIFLFAGIAGGLASLIPFMNSY
ncbi:MAG: DUF5362 domain-containing protein [Candidatus Eisenbacteria bacterium]|nr:DUF5362 domain-containing protein [Candidatus Eisenbacteria bacterium]